MIRLISAAAVVETTLLIESVTAGDCFSYAFAKVTGEALLFKGDDFTQTDITAVAF